VWYHYLASEVFGAVGAGEGFDRLQTFYPRVINDMISPFLLNLKPAYTFAAL
jgi:hypothetical protein